MTNATRAVLFLALLVPRSALSLSLTPSMSSSSSAPQRSPRGCAATPLDKKKVAVFGGGGYLGACAFGFLQRASSLYGTGISPASSPRVVCATAIGLDSLNRCLSGAFRLAYAGEQMARLTDMSSSEAISARLSGFDAAIIGTVYQLESRPVTANTYETGPNSKSYEFFLDEKRSARSDCDELSVHLSMFENTIKACAASGLGHVVVIETPRTVDAAPFAEILDREGVQFTYIRLNGGLTDEAATFSFEKGLRGDLNINGYTLKEGYRAVPGYSAGDWADSLNDPDDEDGERVHREDISALAVQSLMSLDWEKSRCLEVSPGGEIQGGKGTRDGPGARFDRDWCVNSRILADRLLSVE